MPGREKKAFETASRGFSSLNKHRIAYYHWGHIGPTILLVHGWNGRGTQLVPFIEPLLAAGYQILSFDAPGHGRSEGHSTSGIEIINVIKLLADEYGPFDGIIAHSFGGLCTAAALSQGMTANHVVFIAPPANLSGLLEQFSRVLWLNDKVTQTMRLLTERQFGVNIWDQASTLSNARKLTMPGLIIHDENDQEVPWQEGAAIAKAWLNSEFVKTSGLGHRRVLRDRKTVDKVIDFIRLSEESGPS